MTRLLEPSEAYHALLDWQTGFEVEVRASLTPAGATAGLARMFSAFPRLGARLARTPEGFVLEPAPSPVIETTAYGARVHAALSAFTVDAARQGTVVLTGRLHHALCDVTGILSVADQLLGLLGFRAGADSILPRAAREWPIAAESALGRPQPADGIRETRLVFSQAPPVSLKPAQPVTLRLAPERVRALDDLCAEESTSFTALIAAAAAPLLAGDGDPVVVGVPVDCRVFIGPERAEQVPPRAIGNCSHGALVPVPRQGDVLAAARAFDADLLDQVEAEIPAAPFRDSRKYLPENNAPAGLVVSNARGATRRFPRLADAPRTTVLPESSIPALPMIAVNESPGTRAVTVTLIADPADCTPTEARRLIDQLASTLNELVER